MSRMIEKTNPNQMKNILPVEKITYKTQLSKKDIYDRLSNAIRIQKSYTGGWKDNTFSIKRNINYRNSFLPEIKGEICKDAEEETIIKVNMKPHVFVIAFMAIWLGIVFVVCILAASVIISKGFDEFYLIPFGMMIFGLVLFICAFKFESSRSIKDLQDIFQAQIL